MKKTILIISIAFLCFGLKTTYAQTDSVSKNTTQESTPVDNSARWAKIWHKSNPFSISFSTQTLTDESLNLKYKSQFAFSLNKNHNYYLHRTPIAGMVKIGLYVTWYENQFVKYRKNRGEYEGNSLSGSNGGGSYDNFDDYYDDLMSGSDDMGNDDYDSGDIVGAITDNISLGKYFFSMSMFGIGPSVSVSPFYYCNKKVLDMIKLTAYFQYVPTAVGLLFSADGYNALSGGYMGLLRYGVHLSFGYFGIGISHSWGKSKLYKWTINDEAEDLNLDNDEVKYKVGMTNFYIGFRF